MVWIWDAADLEEVGDLSGSDTVGFKVGDFGGSNAAGFEEDGDFGESVFPSLEILIKKKYF